MGPPSAGAVNGLTFPILIPSCPRPRALSQGTPPRETAKAPLGSGGRFLPPPPAGQGSLAENLAAFFRRHTSPAGLAALRPPLFATFLAECHSVGILPLRHRDAIVTSEKRCLEVLDMLKPLLAYLVQYWRVGLKRSPMVEVKREVERIFGTWVKLSKDVEILALLELLVSELRKRQHEVVYDVRPPKPGG